MEITENNNCINNTKQLHKVTVIIPVYNVKDYIRESLDSVINQTYKNLEILIIDDGSNDGSEIICDEYARKDSRIKVFHQQNEGLSAARNKGLDCMTGEYVAFLDSDDVFCYNYVEKLIDSIIEKNVDCVICNFVISKSNGILKFDNIDNMRKKLNISNTLFNKKEALVGLIEDKINMAVWNKLYKKELWSNIRFIVNHVFEDTMATFEVLNNTKNVYIIEDVLLIHRIREGSISRSYCLDNIKDRCMAISWLQEIVKKNIPEIFCEEHCLILYKRNLFFFIRAYIKNNIENTNEKNEINILLQEKVLEVLNIIGEKEYYKGLKIKDRIIYFLYKHNKKLLILVYKVYIKLKKG